MKPKFFGRKRPRVTLVTASGRVLSVVPDEGRHVLAFHGLSALSIADVRGIDDYAKRVFDSVVGNDKSLASRRMQSLRWLWGSGSQKYHRMLCEIDQKMRWNGNFRRHRSVFTWSRRRNSAN